MSNRNLNELPRISDSVSFLYLEYGQLKVNDSCIVFANRSGDLQIPAASLCSLLLGPGSSVTHSAMKALAECGCSVVFCGDVGTKFYCWGCGETRSSANLQVQAYCWADDQRHLSVAKKLYGMRFGTAIPDGISLARLRGMEGLRVQDSYLRASKKWGVKWEGRKYDDHNWQAADPVNKALSVCSSALYGVCHAAIVSLGFSPALGFIHTGKQLSFVYDIADLYKDELVIDTAFEAASDGAMKIEPRARTAFREKVVAVRLMERIVDDLKGVFEGIQLEDSYASEDSVGDLWNADSVLPGGICYNGSDDTGENKQSLSGCSDPMDG